MNNQTTPTKKPPHFPSILYVIYFFIALAGGICSAWGEAFFGDKVWTAALFWKYALIRAAIAFVISSIYWKVIWPYAMDKMAKKQKGT